MTSSHRADPIALPAGVTGNDPPHPHAPVSLRRAAWWAAALLVALAVAAGTRALGNARQSRALADEAAADEARPVLTVRARPGSGMRSLTVPGTVRGRQEAAVYARTGGYLKRLTKDIGDTVRRGELLAELDAPEAEQELGQARAAREQVAARAALAQSSLQRFESLIERDAVSRQEIDERRAALAQAHADLAAADANVRRLQALAALRRVVAPFDGVVLRRTTDIGALISTTNGRELYYLAEIDALRIDLAVPQTYANDLQPGQAVRVRWPERPGLVVEGTISRTAPGIDIATRTRQVVIDLPNPQRRLLPGSYVDVQLAGGNAGKGDAKGTKAGASAAAGPLLAPAGVLQFRKDGPRVALVQDDRVVLRSVTLGRDLGREVELLSGVGPQDALVLNPPDTLNEGDRVSAQAAPEEKPVPEAPPRPASAPRAAGGA
jgi:RND family efflux transporter MFP subunit